MTLKGPTVSAVHFVVATRRSFSQKIALPIRRRTRTCATFRLEGVSTMLLWETVTDLRSGAEALRRGRYGVIEVVDGRLQAVHLRPWPKWISIGAVVWQTWFGRGGRRDRCLVYYDQPLR